MRHIARNQITSISADYQDGNFPASNLLDGRPGRLWKAGGLTRNATLTMEMRGGVSDVALFNTNAREAAATVEDPCAVVFGENPNDENHVVNGVFDSDTAWAKGAGWSIGGGVASRILTGTITSIGQSGRPFVNFKKYRITFSLTSSAGTLGVYLYADGYRGVKTTTGNGNKELVIEINSVSTAYYNSFFFLAQADFSGTIDNVIVSEITDDYLSGGDILKNTTISTTATTTVDENGNALRVNFNPAVTVPCEVAINLTSPGNETLYAGVAFGGTAETYGGANFRYGAGVALNDYSITAQNSNGSRYYKKRTIGKQYNLTALMLRTEADKLEATIRRDGAIASAWALFENSSEMIFGWPQLQRSMDHRLHDNIQLTLTEEI